MKSIRTKKTKLEIPLPEGWHDVPFNVGFDILINANNYDDIKILSLLSGIPMETLRKETDLETIHYVLNSLLFLSSPSYKKYPEFPKSVQGVDLPYVNYSDSFDMGKCEVGQVEDMKALISKHNPKTDHDVISLYPKLCAIYLQPVLKFEDYDYDKSMCLVDEYSEIDFKTITNMGAFFFRRLNGLTFGLPKRWQKLHSLKRKSKRVFGNLAQRLASMLP